MSTRFHSITASLAATNFAFSLDGKTVLQSTSGTFDFSGTGLGEFSFIGGGASAGTDGVSFSMVADFALRATTQAELMGSSDPLGLLLNGSFFVTDAGDPAFLSFNDSLLGANITGRGTAVPEPGTLELMLLGLGAVGLFFHGHRLALPTAA
jgi:hypothetical protein